MEMVPSSIDKLQGPEYIIDMADIHTKLGEYDQALNKIEAVLSMPSQFSTKLLALELTWDQLRSHPRYKQILAKYSK